jgi:hypothetical protein
VKSETMLAPVLDERVLEQLEAEFLQDETSFRLLQSATRLTGAELLALDARRPAGDDEVMRITRWRTRTGCCGG